MLHEIKRLELVQTFKQGFLCKNYSGMEDEITYELFYDPGFDLYYLDNDDQQPWVLDSLMSVCGPTYFKPFNEGWEEKGE